MQRFKSFTLALAVLAAVAAIVGVASASATVLCKENATTCSSESIYPSGTAVEAALKSGSKFELSNKGTGFAETCTTSTISGKTTAERGAPLPLTITGRTFSGCSGTCNTAEANNLPYSAGLDRTTGGNGTLSLSSGGKGNLIVKLSNCVLGVTCYFGASSIAFDLQGGNPGVITNKEATLSKESGSHFACPSTVLWKPASYEITTPKPAYASAGAGVGETAFCKELATVCPSSAAVYPKGTSIEATAKENGLELGEYLGQYVKCESSTMSLENTASSGKPLSIKVPSISFSGCHGLCQNVAIVTPLTGSVEATSGGNGTLTMPFEMKWSNCSFNIEYCAYHTPDPKFTVTGGVESPSIYLPPTPLVRNDGGSTIWCPPVQEVSMGYTIKAPRPFFVTKAET